MDVNLYKFLIRMSKLALYAIVVCQSFLMAMASESLAQRKYLDEINIELATMTQMQEVQLADLITEIEASSDFNFAFTKGAIKNKMIRLGTNQWNFLDLLNEISSQGHFSINRVNETITLIPIENGSLPEIKEQIVIQQSISGQITDQDGEPLPGATIQEKDTYNGTITDVDGRFKIEVGENAMLMISFVGYITQEVEVSGQTEINIQLNPNTAALEEVVVVGYQTKEKKNLTGSVASVDTEKLANRPTARATNLLAGTAPGLTVTRANPGRIGTSAYGLRIGGLVSRAQPDALLVIDGIPQESPDVLNQINPKDIASITVLKDAEASVYGSRAAGGVIVITTNRGGSKPQIGFGVAKSFHTPNIYKRSTNMFEMLEMQEEGWDNNNASFFGYPGLFQYIQDNDLTFDKVRNNDFQYVYGLDNPGTWAPFPDTPFLGFGHTDWREEMYGTGTSNNYDFNISGSGDKTNYYFSLGYVQEQSMLQHANNKSNTAFFRGKFEYNHNEIINAGINVAMRNQNWVEPSRYGTLQNLISQKFTFDHAFTPEGRYMNWGGYQNPIGIAKEGGDATRKYYNLLAQMYVELNPLENLSIKANIARNANFSYQKAIQTEFMHYWWDETPTFGTLSQTGTPTSVSAYNAFNQSLTGNITTRYIQPIGESHTIRALAGFSHEEFENANTSAWRRNLLSENLVTLNLGDSEEQFNSDAQTHSALQAVFANLSYSYKDRYIVEGNYRNDGSSRFAVGYKWKDFYSFSAAWNITNEEFIQALNIQSLNTLKLRGSWGQLGNQSGIALYDFVQQVSVGQSNLLLGPSGAPVRIQTATISGFPALDRTWEITEKTNFGLDLGMFDNQLNLTANYFVTDNSNIFYTEEFPEVLGATPPSINGAQVETKGWDLNIGWNDAIGLSEGFRYNISFGISDANTTVTNLADSRNVAYGYNSFVEGYAVGTMFGFQFDGLIQDDDDLTAYQNAVERTPWAFTNQLIVGDAKYKDLDGDGIVEAALYEVGEDGNPTASSGDMVALGDNERHYEYYFNGGASYKGFDFSFVLSGVGKWAGYDQADGLNTGYPWIQPLEHFYNNTWSPERTGAEYPAISVISQNFSNHRNNNNYGFSDAPYMRRSVPYLAINNIQLGYTVPESISQKISLAKVYIYANATDLGYIINKMPKSYSPEQPFNSNLTPYPRTFSLGVNVNF